MPGVSLPTAWGEREGRRRSQPRLERAARVPRPCGGGGGFVVRDVAIAARNERRQGRIAVPMRGSGAGWGGGERGLVLLGEVGEDADCDAEHRLVVCVWGRSGEGCCGGGGSGESCIGERRPPLPGLPLTEGGSDAGDLCHGGPAAARGGSFRRMRAPPRMLRVRDAGGGDWS